jgi:uncharacterized membrane protein YhaH (DUF805 family)
MEQNQSQPQANATAQAPVPASQPQLINEKPKPSYFTRLFSGRLNRQNYIVGSTFFVLVPLICFTIVIFNILLSASTFTMPYLDPNNPSAIVTPQVSIFSMLQTPTNELWSAIGIIFVILSLPYLLSLQIRRLHDLNLNGWLWIINFLPLLFTKNMISLNELSHPDMWFWIANIVSLITALFSFYISLWPGTKEPNKYGTQPLPRSSFLGDILQVK